MEKIKYIKFLGQGKEATKPRYLGSFKFGWIQKSERQV